jgi:hypothetical protein
MGLLNSIKDVVYNTTNVYIRALVLVCASVLLATEGFATGALCPVAATAVIVTTAVSLFTLAAFVTDPDLDDYAPRFIPTWCFLYVFWVVPSIIAINWNPFSIERIL